jgi:nucleoside-diphosphate-sugar epimerase
MKILVTGATGFVGSHVVKQALVEGHDVIALARNKAKASSFKWFKDVEFISTDISEGVYDVSKLGIPDVLIHLAWSGLPNYKSLFHLEENLPSSMAFLRSALSSGVKRILVTGTCFEFGMQNGELAPDMPTCPENPYAVAKDALRKWLEYMHSEFEFIHQWIRLFYMYGEGQNPKSILAQLKTALENGDATFNMSGGEQLRDYLPIEKVAEKILAYASIHDSSGIHHCCSGNPISIRKLVEDYLLKNNKNIKLNLGFYPYPDYEPIAFWGKE